MTQQAPPTPAMKAGCLATSAKCSAKLLLSAGPASRSTRGAARDTGKRDTPAGCQGAAPSTAVGGLILNMTTGASCDSETLTDVDGDRGTAGTHTSTGGSSNFSTVRDPRD